jgi:4-amino-4-deoxy-L-arabinose transferase-like glycosyltransferase
MAKAARSWRDPILLAILAGSLILNTRGIDHAGLHYFDESFHAIVARNLLKHPLKPTLIDAPYLAYDPTHWGENHVWLHKPILPLWSIAASFAVLGVNTLALRLPSALLATASVGLTFLIGRRLFDRKTGLIAAALQAICPAILMLVQGFLFSDHVDISLLFWVEVGVYFVVKTMQTGAWPDVLAVGMAQGLAYLSKSYLAALLTGLAVVAWLLPRLGTRMASLDDSKWRFKHLAGMIAATLATALPWTIYCARAFPVEFEHEHGYVFTHVGQGVENWGGPWDRLVFDHLIGLYHGFYTPWIAAGIVLLGSALTSRRTPLWFLYAWLLGVLLPHLLAATKTPSATLIALPAGFLLLSRLMVEGWEGRLRPLTAWASIMVVVAVEPSRIGRFSRGFPQPRVFGGVMLGASWVFEHLILAGAIVLVIERIARAVSTRKPNRLMAWTRWPDVLRGVAMTATLIVGCWVARASWSLTAKQSEDRPFVTELARFARDRLPTNAVLLFDGGGKGDHQTAMFLLDRTCYSLQGRPLDELAGQILGAGGIPYIVTANHESAPWPLRFAGTFDPRGLYEWQPSAFAARSGLVKTKNPDASPIHSIAPHANE